MAQQLHELIGHGELFRELLTTLVGTVADVVDPGAERDIARVDGEGVDNVEEFAREVALAAVEPVPAANTRLVGDVEGFGAAEGTA